jgi:hypothetical protein
VGIIKKRTHAYGRQTKSVHEPFSAFPFARRNLRCRCYTDHLRDDVSCLGSGEDVEVVCWLPELAEWQPELRELQAVHPTVLLQAR